MGATAIARRVVRGFVLQAPMDDAPHAHDPMRPHRVDGGERHGKYEGVGNRGQGAFAWEGA